MRHDPAGAAIVVMLRGLKMFGMAQAAGELMEQGAPASIRPSPFCHSCSRRKPPSARFDRLPTSSRRRASPSTRI